MKGTGKAPLVGLALLAGLMTVVLGRSAGWPLWLWVVPAAVSVVLAILLASARSPDPEPEPAAPDPDEPQWEETRVDDVALPSRVPDYDFRFSATVWWRPIPNATGLVHADPASLAIETVLSRAREVTEREVPERLDLVMHRLNGVLGTQVPDASRLVEAMGGRVDLRLSEEDRSRLGKLAEVRKTEEVWEHERRYEQSKRAYLGDDVLKSPGSAVVWWLARHDDKVTEAVDLIGPLAQLSAAANDEPVDDLYKHLVPQPAAQAIPFLEGVAPCRRRGDEPDGGIDAGPWDHPPTGPTGPTRGPLVIGPLNQLLDDVELARESPERAVYAHRVAAFTDAMGRPDQARLIREGLLSDGHPAPGSVPGQQRINGQPDEEPGVRGNATR
ncbi:hypothetical protein [Streptomyces sp. NRRL B-24484]|uniref:hypothetical protein n=1 Tax=Streptomyces sp. NRRL B-24484 TaxID=1463833 RepID=UPI0006944B13|nr:hypothetical protein [Streptomyces sp. NRRL B-24484]